MYTKCPHCKKEIDIRMTAHPRTPSLMEVEGPAKFNLPKSWEKYAGMTLKDVHAIDPTYLDHLVTRMRRPIIGLLADKINDFLGEQ